MRTELFGTVYDSPFSRVQQEAKDLSTRMVNSRWRAPQSARNNAELSTATSTAVEDVCKAHGAPVCTNSMLPTSGRRARKSCGALSGRVPRHRAHLRQHDGAEQ